MEFLKKQGLLTKARLCLYLVFGSGLLGCSALRQRDKPDTGLKASRISGALLPGYDESSLYTALDGTTIMHIDQLPEGTAFGILPEKFTLTIRLNDKMALQQVLSRLQSSGFRIGNTTLQNYNVQ